MHGGIEQARSRSPRRRFAAEAPAQLRPLGASTVLESSSLRSLGCVRWYSGRRQLGVVDGDDGRELFIPVGGATNRNFVPPNCSGLMHGTRVSYTKVPLTDKDVVRSSSLSGACVDVRPADVELRGGLECGVETRIGGRTANEDRLVANDLYDLGFLAGIFDGHGGSSCVDYVSQRLPVALHAAYTARAGRLQHGVAALTPGQEEDLISGAIHDAFEATDEEFMEAARQHRLQDGSTGLVVLVIHGFEALPLASSVSGCKGGVAKLFVGNCGDCRAILLRGRKVLRLSEDHKPERGDEMARIKKAGGIVIQEANGTYRVGRKKGEHRTFLSTSRSFGDLDLKEPRPLVIAEPEVKVQTLTPEDWGVVLACDGVWNTMSDQDVADAVWHAIAQKGGGPVEAAREVANRAEATGSTDNITVLVMRLGWAQPPARVT